MPYEPVGVFLIDQWRKIGLNPTQVLETAAYNNDLRGGNYDVALDFNCDFMDDPDLQLSKFISANRSPINYCRYADPRLDELYDRQTREPDPSSGAARPGVRARRAQRAGVAAADHLVAADHPAHSQVRGWKISPSHYLNQDLATSGSPRSGTAHRRRMASRR